MAKNDVVVRSAADLERKYNFAALLGLKKNVEITAQGMQKLENELNLMLNALVINLKDVLDDQSEVSLWFYSGVPTTENEPYTLWSNPNDHIGDIYYDKNSGYVYQYNGVWEVNTHPDLIEAMAITNSETDTSEDHERKVFFSTPTVPYSNGDWWIKEDGSLFICQISKNSGTYETMDFIDSSNYVESVVEKIGEEIKVLKGTITIISENYAKFTDLATGGSTTISGDNIVTGTIKSQNYIANKSGTKLSLEDGVIDSKNFKVDSSGNMTCNDATINGSAFFNGDNFSVSKDGKITSKAGKIGGYDIGATNLSANISWSLPFSIATQAEFQNVFNKITNYANGTGSLTANELKLYDVNGDGIVDKLDSLMISRIYYGYLKTSGKLIINSGNYKETLCFQDSNGNIIAYMGLGGIATNFLSAEQLSVSGTTQVQDLTVKGSFANNSDKRLKKDINELNDNYINVVKEATPVEFTYKENESKHIGFIAQDLEEVFKNNKIEEIPIKIDETGLYSIDYLSLIGILWKSNQDLYKRIEILERGVK